MEFNFLGVHFGLCWACCFWDLWFLWLFHVDYWLLLVGYSAVELELGDVRAELLMLRGFCVCWMILLEFRVGGFLRVWCFCGVNVWRLVGLLFWGVFVDVACGWLGSWGLV